MGVRADELARLVDEEVEPKAFGLLIEPRHDLVGEVLDGDRVLVAVLGQDVGRCAALAAHLGVGRGHVGFFENAFLSTLGPVTSGNPPVRVLERCVLTAVVEVSFEARDVALVPVVTATLVEDLHEHLQQGVGLILCYERGLLIDVKQKALGWDALGLCQKGGQESASCFGAEAFRGLGAVKRLALDIAEKVSEHLQKV